MFEIRKTDRFEKWLNNLRDRTAQDRILRRLDRVTQGHFGDVKPVGGSVSEMRIHYGPGYRLYFTQQGQQIIILLCGGNKSTQQRDIALAQSLVEE